MPSRPGGKPRPLPLRDAQKVKAIFADTFYFLALLRLEDSAHARAIAASQNRTERLITTAWILTEVADALAAPAMREGGKGVRYLFSVWVENAAAQFGL